MARSQKSSPATLVAPRAFDPLEANFQTLVLKGDMPRGGGMKPVMFPGGALGHETGSDLQDQVDSRKYFYLNALLLNESVSISGYQDSWDQDRQNGNIKRYRRGGIKVLGPKLVIVSPTMDRWAVSLFYVIYSHYTEATILPPVTYINESEDVLGSIQITSSRETFNNFHQPNHRNVPAQTIEATQGGIQDRVFEVYDRARRTFENDSGASVALNSFLNEYMSLFIDPYVVHEINDGLLADQPVKVAAWDVGIKVDSISWDLVQQRISFVIGDFTLAFTLSVRDFAFGNVMIVRVSGSVSAVYRDGRLESNLQVTVQQGEQNAPDLARKIQQELNLVVERASKSVVGRVLDWIQAHS